MILAKLDTARLNVVQKTRSNLFGWRGQFTPQFVDYLLETFADPGQVVLDPFCGSGTVLQEAASHGLLGIGLEINPAAYAMAKFFSLSGLGAGARRQLITRARDLLCSVAARFDGLSLFKDSSDYRQGLSNLTGLARDVLGKTDDKLLRLLLLLAMFRAENSRNGNLVATVLRSLEYLSEQLLLLPSPARAPKAFLCDARNAHIQVKEPANLILTSPPYINVFNYHQNYRALLELFGFDMLRIARSEIGSNRKNRGNRFFTVIQYCLDLEQALISFARCLAPSGLLIMVVGRESCVRGVPFGNSAIVKALIAGNGAFDDASAHERVFVNRFGISIYEDVLVARRVGECGRLGAGREVALSVLRQALGEVAGAVRRDIEQALSISVKSSPMFGISAVI